jgi:aspartate/methionine/tyrosine aminotransferase
MKHEICPSITDENIRKFCSLLERFWEEVNALEGTDRFIRTLDHMFGTFVLEQQEGGLPMGGNLDTGDAHGEAFPPFTRALSQHFSDRVEIKKYYGPEALSEVKRGVKSLGRMLGLAPAEVLEQHNVVVGAGTVNLYDVACRQLIRRRRDAFLLPTPTYGFFIPQIRRTGGVPLFLAGQESYRLSSDEIAHAADQYNAARLKEWRLEWKGLLTVFSHELSLRYNVDPIEISDVCLRQDLRALTDPEEIDRRIAEALHSFGLGEDVLNHPDLTPPTPSRVVGLLHINPNVCGYAYGEDEVRGIANVCAQRGITIVEDLAYYPIQCTVNPKEISSVMNQTCPALVLMGISKPFAVANMRLGVGLAKEPIASRLMRRVENSIGFVSRPLQLALADMLLAGDEALECFLEKGNSESDGGYQRKLKLIYFGLEGWSSQRLSTKDKEMSEAVFREEIFQFHDGPIAREFFEVGLSPWLEPVFDPDWGLFVIVDCQRAIRRFSGSRLPIRSSFDVFALLAFFCGVRSIPGETMGLEKNGAEHQLLRLSFSCATSVLVKALYVAWVGLSKLESSKIWERELEAQPIC